VDKPWQIFAAGLGTLTLFCLLLVDPKAAFLASSAFLFSLFTLGFLYQPQVQLFTLTLGPVEEGDPVPRMSGQLLGAPYPLEYIFRIELRNLWLAAAVAFIPMAVFIWYWSTPGEIVLHGFPPLELTILPMYMFGSVWWVLKRWLTERRMLTRVMINWASIFPGDCGISYQFYDHHGERHGGMATEKNLQLDADDNLAIVIAKADNPDISKLSCTFFFHRFVAVDVRNGIVPLAEKILPAGKEESEVSE
jgi:hypothetical protein